MTEAIESTAEEVGTEVVPAAPTNLFRTDDPVEVVQRASRVADSLKDVLKRQGLTARIQGREHVKVEGWTTLGSMLGVVPVVTWTRKLDNGWEARVEARTLDGRVIGAAESSCTKDEKTWKSRDDYALQSMAQTRATSKALRGPLGFIVTLAGYQATPAEEMPQDAAPASQEPSTPRLSEELVKELLGISEQAMALDGWDTEKLKKYLVAAGATEVWTGAPSKGHVKAALSSLTQKGAEELKGELVAALASAEQLTEAKA